MKKTSSPTFNTFFCRNIVDIKNIDNLPPSVLQSYESLLDLEDLQCINETYEQRRFRILLRDDRLIRLRNRSQ